MNEKAKKLRVRLHLIMSYIMSHRAWRLESSPDVAMAKLSLQQSRHWLGKLLGQLGEENPYPNSMELNQTIEPPADVAKPEPWPVSDPIEQIKWLRSEIEGELLILKGLRDEVVQSLVGNMTTLKGVVPTVAVDLRMLTINMAYIHLTEAKMWLGEELGRNFNGEEGPINWGKPDEGVVFPKAMGGDNTHNMQAFGDVNGPNQAAEGSTGAHHATNGSMGIDNEVADRGKTPVNESGLRPAPNATFVSDGGAVPEIDGKPNRGELEEGPGNSGEGDARWETNAGPDSSDGPSGSMALGGS